MGQSSRRRRRVTVTDKNGMRNVSLRVRVSQDSDNTEKKKHNDRHLAQCAAQNSNHTLKHSCLLPSRKQHD